MFRLFSRFSVPAPLCSFSISVYIVLDQCSLLFRLDDVGIEHSFNHLGIPSSVLKMGARPSWSYPALLTWLLAADPVLSHPKPTGTVSTASLETQYPPQIENARVILPADTGVSQSILVGGVGTDTYVVLSDQIGE